MRPVVLAVAAAAALIAAIPLASADEFPTGNISGSYTETLNGVIFRYQPSDTPADSDPHTKNTLVNSKTAVTLDGKPSNLGALKPGMGVRFSAAENEGVLQHLEAFTHPIDGKIRDADGVVESAKPDQLTYSKNNAKTTVKLDLDTQILLDAQPATFDQLRHGMMTKLQVKDGIAVSVKSVTNEMDGANHRCEGDLSKVSADSFAIHVWGADGFDCNFTLAPNIKITRNNAPATLADFKPGEKVVANYIDGVAQDLALSPPQANNNNNGNNRGGANPGNRGGGNAPAGGRGGARGGGTPGQPRANPPANNPPAGNPPPANRPGADMP